MRVAMVTADHGPGTGGVGRQVAGLARALVARGVEVDVLTHGRATRVPPAARGRDGVAVRRFTPPVVDAGYAMSQELWAWLRRHGHAYDVVHAHGARTLPAMMATRGTYRHLAFTPHWHRDPASGVRRIVQPLYRRLGAPGIAGADLIVCGTGAEADEVARVEPAARPRIRIVPVGTDVDAIATAAPMPTPGPAILSLGRLDHTRRVDRLIAALPSLDPAFGLVVVGGGPAASALRAHAADLRVAGRVRLLGALEDRAAHRWLRGAAVVATMAEQPRTGAALLEARAAGVPVVASDVPAHREAAALVGEDGVTLVAPGLSPIHLAGALAAAAAAPRLPVPAAGLPTWDLVAERTLALYEDLVARGRTAVPVGVA